LIEVEATDVRFGPIAHFGTRTQTAGVSDQVSGILCLVLGVGTGGYLIYGWRKGELQARGICKRSDGPVTWWSAVLTLAAFGGSCTYAGILMLSR